MKKFPKLDLINDIGEGKRDARCRNIALVFKTAYDMKGNEKFIHKCVVRSHILKSLNIVISDKDLIDGDNRAHGDACGGHGLHLEIEGRGIDGKILFTKDNYKKCVDFLESSLPVNTGEFVIVD